MNATVTDTDSARRTAQGGAGERAAFAAVTPATHPAVLVDLLRRAPSADAVEDLARRVTPTTAPADHETSTAVPSLSADVAALIARFAAHLSPRLVRRLMTSPRDVLPDLLGNPQLGSPAVHGPVIGWAEAALAKPGPKQPTTPHIASMGQIGRLGEGLALAGILTAATPYARFCLARLTASGATEGLSGNQREALLRTLASIADQDPTEIASTVLGGPTAHLVANHPAATTATWIALLRGAGNAPANLRAVLAVPAGRRHPQIGPYLVEYLRDPRVRNHVSWHELALLVGDLANPRLARVVVALGERWYRKAVRETIATGFPTAWRHRPPETFEPLLRSEDAELRLCAVTALATLRPTERPTPLSGPPVAGEPSDRRSPPVAPPAVRGP